MQFWTRLYVIQLLYLLLGVVVNQLPLVYQSLVLLLLGNCFLIFIILCCLFHASISLITEVFFVLGIQISLWLHQVQRIWKLYLNLLSRDLIHLNTRYIYFHSFFFPPSFFCCYYSNVLLLVRMIDNLKSVAYLHSNIVPWNMLALYGKKKKRNAAR